MSGSYDLGDGNTMDIDAVDNTTTTTFNNNIDGEYVTIKSEKNDTATSTLFNDTMLMTTDREGSYQLENIKTKDSMQISNQYQLDIWTSTEIHSNATFDDVENDLDSFYYEVKDASVPGGGFFNMSYLKDDPDGYDINVLNGYPTGYMNAHLNYENGTNEFKWYDTTHNPYVTSEYTINVSGVWRDNTQVIDWTNPDLQTYGYNLTIFNPFPPPGPWVPIYQINITKYYETVIIHYYGGDLADPGDLYELVFRKTFQDLIVMDWNGQNILWQWKQMLISVSVPMWNEEGEKDFFFAEFHLWNINDLIYIVLGAHTNLDLAFYRVWNQLVLDGITYVMNYYVPDYLHFGIGTIWEKWGIGIEIIFDLLQNTYLGYKVEIRYTYYEYVYLVPTLFLPNFLTITIIESVYTDTWFYITIRVSNFMGYSGPGATITGTWDGDDIGSVDDNDDGTYNFTLPAKFVLSGGDPLWLNLTASGVGYANGILNTGIAVEPPPIIPPPPPKQLKINIVESIYLDDSFNFVVEVTNCSGDLETGTGFSGNWNDITLTGANITDNPDGTFDLAVTPVYVSGGGDPIWLNLTATKSGYDDGVLNTEIAVEPFYTTDPPPLPRQLIIKIVESIYLDDSFNFLVEVTNCSGDLETGTTFSGKWNGIDLTSANITDKGDGTFDLTLTPIFVPRGGVPIWLNLTATKTAYFEGELKTEIAVQPYPRQLKINIINSVYTPEWFNLTVAVTNCTGDLVKDAILSGTWNGTLIQLANITDNGDGTFNITLDAILVSPDDPGIVLSLTATKGPYTDGILDTTLKVDPEAVSKISPPPPDGDGDGGGGGGGKKQPEALPLYLFLIGIAAAIAIISIVLIIIKKRATR